MIDFRSKDKRDDGRSKETNNRHRHQHGNYSNKKRNQQHSTHYLSNENPTHTISREILSQRPKLKKVRRFCRWMDLFIFRNIMIAQYSIKTFSTQKYFTWLVYEGKVLVGDFFR